MAKTKNTSDSSDNGTQPQPGAVISPGASPQPAVEPAQAPAEPATPIPAAAVPVAPTPPTPETPEPATEAPVPTERPESAYDLPSTSDSTQLADDDQSVTWTASEFIAHDKPAGWYAMLAGGTLLLAALIFFLTKDIISTAVVVVAGLLLGVYGAHKPRQLGYRVDKRGISIGQKYHGYNEFRSFSVVPEGAFASIVFMPLKRFALPTTIYYAPDDEDRILAVLIDQLPFEEHRRDAVDNLMRHIRF